MRILCVDDEPLILQLTTSLCEEMEGVAEVKGFTDALTALSWLDTNETDLAILDIDMPQMNGLVLAAEIKKKRPDTRIIFLTGYSQYALDAFAVHASGYLLKPINREKLYEEIRYAFSSIAPPQQTAHITARTFGNFDLIVDGETVFFGRSKAKELMAYLVDRNGSSITRPEAFAVLWEDDAPYDRPRQKQLDVVIRSLCDTLENYDIREILEMGRGYLRIRPELIDCDLYRFLSGDVATINSFRGDYMQSYSWASITESYLYWTKHQEKE